MTVLLETCKRCCSVWVYYVYGDFMIVTRTAQLRDHFLQNRQFSVKFREILPYSVYLYMLLIFFVCILEHISNYLFSFYSNICYTWWEPFTLDFAKGAIPRKLFFWLDWWIVCSSSLPAEWLMLKLVTVLKRFSKNMHIGLIFLHISVKSDIFAKKAAIKFETSLYEIGWALTDSETGCCCCCCSCCCDAIALITHALQFHTHTARHAGFDARI